MSGRERQTRKRDRERERDRQTDRGVCGILGFLKKRIYMLRADQLGRAGG